MAKRVANWEDGCTTHVTVRMSIFGRLTALSLGVN